VAILFMRELASVDRDVHLQTAQLLSDYLVTTFDNDA
jgi:hypothetical protein